MLSNLPSTIEEGSDPSLDAEAAMQTLYKHVKSLISYECSNASGVPITPAPKTKSFNLQPDEYTSHLSFSMRHQVLLPRPRRH